MIAYNRFQGLSEYTDAAIVGIIHPLMILLEILKDPNLVTHH